MGEGPAPVAGQIAACGMHRLEAESDGISRFQGPGHDIVIIGAAGDIRQVHIVIVAPVKIRVGQPFDGAHEPFPAMRTSNDPDRGRLGYGIERHPETDGLVPLDAVVGDVLVPGRFLFGMGLFHQHVVMEELRGLGPHDFGGDARDIGFQDEPPELGDSFPVAIVVEEPAGLAFFRVLRTVRPGRGHVRRYPFGQQWHPLRENAA